MQKAIRFAGREALFAKRMALPREAAICGKRTMLARHTRSAVRIVPSGKAIAVNQRPHVLPGIGHYVQHALRPQFPIKHEYIDRAGLYLT